MSKSVFNELKYLATEARNPNTMGLDTMSTREILEAMNREDRSVPEIVAQAIPQIEKAVELVVNAFRSGGRLIYVGAGTSGRLGIIDAAECPPTFGTEPWMVQGFIAGGQGAVFKAVEGAEDDSEQAGKDLDICCINQNDVICGITASRRTPYVIGSLNYAKDRAAKRMLVICNMEPDTANDIADVVISVPVGPEVLTGSTRLKAGTATKLVLNMITTAAMVRLGKCYENLMVDLRAGSEKLRARSRRIFMELTGADYEWADQVLTQAAGELKTALVMHFRGVSAEHARDLLDQHGGIVRKAMEERMKDEG
ncbi:N-acetylmuramic acid 6-phosphate etherase [bacterium]|nr:N-acetylmuramic acid 6-phosphate etherase [bacterium]MBU1985404.1 N-acetylmuramic acid 6-phosphate etherase [bacterium]